MAKEGRRVARRLILAGDVYSLNSRTKIYSVFCVVLFQDV